MCFSQLYAQWFFQHVWDYVYNKGSLIIQNSNIFIYSYTFFHYKRKINNLITLHVGSLIYIPYFHQMNIFIWIWHRGSTRDSKHEKNICVLLCKFQSKSSLVIYVLSMYTYYCFLPYEKFVYQIRWNKNWINKNVYIFKLYINFYYWCKKKFNSKWIKNTFGILL